MATARSLYRLLDPLTEAFTPRMASALLELRAARRQRLQVLPDSATGDATNCDPDTRAVVWSDHFVVRRGYVVGLTPTGSATVRLLNMNAPRRVELRGEWLPEIDCRS
jgi:hypothetical protein